MDLDLGMRTSVKYAGTARTTSVTGAPCERSAIPWRLFRNMERRRSGVSTTSSPRYCTGMPTLPATSIIYKKRQRGARI